MEHFYFFWVGGQIQRLFCRYSAACHEYQPRPFSSLLLETLLFSPFNTEPCTYYTIRYALTWRTECTKNKRKVLKLPYFMHCRISSVRLDQVHGLELHVPSFSPPLLGPCSIEWVKKLAKSPPKRYKNTPISRSNARAVIRLVHEDAWIEVGWRGSWWPFTRNECPFPKICDRKTPPWLRQRRRTDRGKKRRESWERGGRILSWDRPSSKKFFSNVNTNPLLHFKTWASRTIPLLVFRIRKEIEWMEGKFIWKTLDNDLKLTPLSSLSKDYLVGSRVAQVLKVHCF